MDDLISRKAAIEEFEEMVTSVSVYGESAEARYANNARLRFIEKLADIPSIPAVPLDKLCEWLGMHVVPPVSDCLLTTEARTAAWKAVLNKFVEEQDAAD